MSEIEPCCHQCSRQYNKLLSAYWYQRRQIRKMRKAFAAIECALTHKCERATEFIIGECEAYRGNYVQKCQLEKLEPSGSNF